MYTWDPEYVDQGGYRTGGEYVGKAVAFASGGLALVKWAGMKFAFWTGGAVAEAAAIRQGYNVIGETLFGRALAFAEKIKVCAYMSSKIRAWTPLSVLWALEASVHSRIFQYFPRTFVNEVAASARSTWNTIEKPILDLLGRGSVLVPLK